MPTCNINAHLHMYTCTPCACRIASQRAYIMYYSGLRHCWLWVRSWYPVVLRMSVEVREKMKLLSQERADVKESWENRNKLLKQCTDIQVYQ